MKKRIFEGKAEEMYSTYLENGYNLNVENGLPIDSLRPLLKGLDGKHVRITVEVLEGD